MSPLGTSGKSPLGEIYFPLPSYYIVCEDQVGNCGGVNSAWTANIYMTGKDNSTYLSSCYFGFSVAVKQWVKLGLHDKLSFLKSFYLKTTQICLWISDQHHVNLSYILPDALKDDR